VSDGPPAHGEAPARQDLPRWAILALSAVLLLSYYLIFVGFFPLAVPGAGLLGNDYSWFLPSMLDSHFWFKANGLFSVQWFSPAFCGGLPKLANPQDLTYSLPQLLFSLSGPIWGLRLTLLTCGALGLTGCYALLRGPFQASRAAALLGGGVFLFNGFFVDRLIVGHLSFHAFMLVPWAAFFALRAGHKEASPPGEAGALALGPAVHGALCGIAMAYMLCSGMVHLILPSGLFLLGCGLLLALLRAPSFALGRFLRGLCAAGAWSLALSAAHILLSLAYLQHAPRDFYQIPTARHLLDFTVAVFTVLFLRVPDPDRLGALLTESKWFLGHHEWSFGVSYVPLLAGAIYLVMAVQRRRPLRRPGLSLSWPAPRASLLLLGLLAILSLPLLLNLDWPVLQALLKRLPLFRNSSNLLRWLCLYVPFAALFTGLALERSRLSGRLHAACGALLVGLVLIANLGVPHVERSEVRFHPGRVVHGYEQAERPGFQPAVHSIVISADRRGRQMQTLGRNDVMAEGKSQLICYEPMFGYSLETFPFKTLRPGPALREKDGVLNVKNPACFLFPRENGCQPGDHFRVEQRAAAEAFLRYRPFPFAMPARQVWANRLFVLTVLALLGLFAAAAVQALRRRPISRLAPVAVPASNGRAVQALRRRPISRPAAARGP
jgi:hypothetical protein